MENPDSELVQLQFYANDEAGDAADEDVSWLFARHCASLSSNKRFDFVFAAPGSYQAHQRRPRTCGAVSCREAAKDCWCGRLLQYGPRVEHLPREGAAGRIQYAASTCCAGVEQHG
jgi:hypothetical protein